MTNQTATQPEEESELLAALATAYEKSPYWRSRLIDLNIRDSDFAPGFPFHELPLISKKDLLEDQNLHPPFGRILAVEPTKIRRIHRTSGTISKPLIITLTDRDIADTYAVCRRAFQAAGIGPQDRIVHCLNFNMWSGGVTDYIPLEQVGATCVPFGVGNTLTLIDMIRNLGINAIHSTPSYMFVLRDRCRDALGIDPRELGLTRGYFGGEGVLQVPGVREEIEDAFDMKAFDANYGMSEVLSIVGGEDQDRNGLVHHGHGVVYTELVDANGKSVKIEPGARGELVFSSLRREAQPLFRYRTNDMAEVLSSSVAEDGLPRIRFRIVGRSDDMLVIKGLNFFPHSLLSIFPQFEREVGREFRVVRPKATDTGPIIVALETELANENEKSELAARIRNKINATFHFTVEIRWFEPGTIPRSDNKARFVVDSVDSLTKAGG